MFSEIYQHMMSRLEDELPPWLYYHSPDHTRYVLEKTRFLAETEAVSEEDMELLKLAALYHDSGFLIAPQDHEQTSCELAREDLKRYGFETEKIDRICQMILATRIPQKPRSLLEKILADADLEYLGTAQFFPYANKLYKEILHFNPDLSRPAWNRLQVEFLSAHSYHTRFCKRYREPVKQKHLAVLTKGLNRNP